MRKVLAVARQAYWEEHVEAALWMAAVEAATLATLDWALGAVRQMLPTPTRAVLGDLRPATQQRMWLALWAVRGRLPRDLAFAVAAAACDVRGSLVRAERMLAAVADARLGSLHDYALERWYDQLPAPIVVECSVALEACGHRLVWEEWTQFTATFVGACGDVPLPLDCSSDALDVLGALNRFYIVDHDVSRATRDAVRRIAQLLEFFAELERLAELEEQGHFED